MNDPTPYMTVWDWIVVLAAGGFLAASVAWLFLPGLRLRWYRWRGVQLRRKCDELDRQLSALRRIHERREA